MNLLLRLTALCLVLVCMLSAGENIAVLDLDADGVTPAEAKTLTNKLRGELIATGLFTVIERGQMAQILKEQGFQGTGCTSQECVVEVGQLLGVQTIVAGNIGKVGTLYVVSLRMIDVAKGNITRSIEEDVTGDVTLVLLTGMHNAARKIAGLEADKPYEQAAAPAVQPPTPVESPAAEEPVSLKRAAFQARQPQLREPKPKPRRCFSIEIGRNTMEADSFHWGEYGVFGRSYYGIKWEPGIQFGLRFGLKNFYVNPEGSGIFFGLSDVGLFYEHSTSSPGPVTFIDSLFPIPLQDTLTAKSFTLSRVCLYDYLTFGYRVYSKPLAFEPYSGIGFIIDWGILSGEKVDTLNLLRLSPRLVLPFGIRMFIHDFFLGFEYNKVFKILRTQSDPKFNSKTNGTYESDLPVQSASFWAIHIGTAFGAPLKAKSEGVK